MRTLDSGPIAQQGPGSRCLRPGGFDSAGGCMWHLVNIAYRNTRRNLRRSAFVVISIMVSIVAILVIQSFINGLHTGLIEHIALKRSGDFQLQAAGYQKQQENLPLDKTLSNPVALGSKVVAAGLAESFSPRIQFGAVLSNSKTTLQVVGMGVDPAFESQVTTGFAKLLVKGRYLAPGAQTEALITSKLADNLSVGVGSELLLLAYTRDGSLNAVDVLVVGLISDSLPLSNNRLVVLNQSNAELLLQMQNEATEIAFRRSARARDFSLDKIAQHAQAFNKNVVALGWWNVASIFDDIMGIQNAVFAAVKLILFVIVVSNIANNLLTSIYERTSEIGTLTALGMPRPALVTLFSLETLFLTLLGTAAGLTVAALVVGFFNSYGFHYQAPGTGFPLSIFPFLRPSDVVVAIFFAALCSVISSIYPAWNAASLEPSIALRVG